MSTIKNPHFYEKPIGTSKSSFLGKYRHFLIFDFFCTPTSTLDGLKSSKASFWQSFQFFPIFPENFRCGRNFCRSRGPGNVGCRRRRCNPSGNSVLGGVRQKWPGIKMTFFYTFYIFTIKKVDFLRKILEKFRVFFFSTRTSFRRIDVFDFFFFFYT